MSNNSQRLLNTDQIADNANVTLSSSFPAAYAAANAAYAQANAGSVAGANQQIQYNNSGSPGANANLTFNVASQQLSVEANVQLANSSNLYFGGGQANAANASFVVTYNISANSLDFLWI